MLTGEAPEHHLTKKPFKGNPLPDGNPRTDGVLEKRTPHHDLAAVQSMVALLGAASFTKTALDGGRAMDLTSVEMLGIVSVLNQGNFYKAMTCYADRHSWQDVYHACAPNGKIAYIKFILRDNAPVIQFKEK